MTTLLRIRPPLASVDEASTDRGPLLAEAVLSALHSGHETFALEVGFRQGKVGLAARGTDHMIPVLRQQLYAQYPDAELSESEDDKPAPCLSRELDLEQSDLQPLKSYPLFLDHSSRRLVDPLAAILSALDGEPAAKVEILLTPAHHIRHRATKALPILDMHLAHRFHKYGRWLTRIRLARGWKRWPCWLLALLLCKRGHGSGTYAGAQEKLGHPLFYTTIRLSAAGQEAAARRKLEELTAAFQAFALPGSNSFVARPIRKGMPKAKVSCLLSAQEVATLWHCPGPLTRPVSFDFLSSRKLEPPVDLPTEGDIIILGEAVFRGRATPFGIKQEDRKRHMYIVGKSGTGKSTTLENLIFSDMKAGRGVSVIDPHGDLVEACLRFLPRNRLNDLVLLEPGELSHPFAFNPLDCKLPEQRPLVASGIVSTMEHLFPSVWSARASYILRCVVSALLESENTTLLGVLRVLTDKPYRQKIVSNVQNQVVRAFFDKEYEVWSDKYKTEAIATLQNKIGQLLSVPMLKGILGQPKSTVDILHIMDSRKLLLVNLSKGKLGSDVSAFLGSMLVSAYQLAAMARQNTPQNQRVPHTLVVDELHSFISPAFVNMLGESRKFAVALVLASQFLGQLILEDKSTTLLEAVWGNTATQICFQCGADDAEAISLQMEQLVKPADLLGLPRYHAYFRMAIDGSPSKPFSVKTRPPPPAVADERLIATARRQSRERYCEERSKVEAQIARWMCGGSPDQKANRRNPTTKAAQHQA